MSKCRWAAPGRMVDMGNGSRLHVYEMGSGPGPAIILEAGLCATSLNWRDLQCRLAQFGRVVAYDRAGLGWSDACAAPRTPFHLSIELRSMLEAAEIEPPYILVGHSFGTLIARSFCSLFRSGVAGVVLLDPFLNEDTWPLPEECQKTIERGIRLARRCGLLARLGVNRCLANLMLRGAKFLPQAMGTAIAGERTGALDRVTRQVRKMPRELWPMIADHWSTPQFYSTAAAYLEALDATAQEMASVEPIEGMPVVIVTGAKSQSADATRIRRIASNADHIEAKYSGHWIHLDEPETVVRAVQEVMTCEVVHRGR